jgi:phosphoglycerate dehydrogenase-like enzyme
MSDTVAVLGVLAPEELEALRAALGDTLRDDGLDVVLIGGEQAARQNASLVAARYLVVRDQPASDQILEAAPQLRAVIRLDSGSATVDEALCMQRGIPVFVVRSPTLVSVAEHTILLILALFKRFVVAMDDLRAGVVVGGVQPAMTTQRSYAYNWIGLQGFDALWGKHVGLVGLGKIGREVAIRLRAFGVEVAYTKRSPLASDEERSLGVRFLPRDELLQVSDCVSLHHRFDESSERYMGGREFALMKPGSYFVNTARGRLVDEAALLAALRSGHLAGAALDVFWYEPLPTDSPLLQARNLILTPHVGGIPSRASSLTELGEAGRLIRSRHQGAAQTHP